MEVTKFVDSSQETEIYKPLKPDNKKQIKAEEIESIELDDWFNEFPDNDDEDSEDLENADTNPSDTES